MLRMPETQNESTTRGSLNSVRAMLGSPNASSKKEVDFEACSVNFFAAIGGRICSMEQISVPGRQNHVSERLLQKTANNALSFPGIYGEYA